MPILKIYKYFIDGVSSLDVPMLSNVTEQEYLSLILKFRLTLKFHVYPFDDGIICHNVNSLALDDAD